MYDEVTINTFGGLVLNIFHQQIGWVRLQKDMLLQYKMYLHCEAFCPLLCLKNAIEIYRIKFRHQNGKNITRDFSINFPHLQCLFNAKSCLSTVCATNIIFTIKYNLYIKHFSLSFFQFFTLFSHNFFTHLFSLSTHNLIAWHWRCNSTISAKCRLRNILYTIPTMYF